MDDVGTRLDKAAEIGGFKSRRQMAKELGISYSTLNKWVDNNRITEKGAIQIASKIPISQTYLLTGEGDPELTDSGVSNYAHPVRISEMVACFEQLGDKEQKAFYQLICAMAAGKDDDIPVVHP